MTAIELARYIEHTLLKPEAIPSDIDELCEQAVAKGFFGVCVNPVYVGRSVARIDACMPGTSPSNRPVVVTVAGFPLGASESQTKADEARRAIDSGAREVDMVANIGALRCGDGKTVRLDIETVAAAVHATSEALLKVILETRLLTREQVVLGCRCCAEAQVDFVKTSTGMHPSGGATVEDVAMLHRIAAPISVKAAGGIRTFSEALAMIEAGAVRIGTSNGCAILDQCTHRGSDGASTCQER